MFRVLLVRWRCRSGFDDRRRVERARDRGHLADCELVFGLRLRQTLAEDVPACSRSIREVGARYGNVMRSALAMFRTTREWNLLLIEGATAGTQAQITHPERGTMSSGRLSKHGRPRRKRTWRRVRRILIARAGDSRTLLEGVVDVADEVAEVAAAVEQGDHGVAGGGFGGGVVGVDGGVPLGVEGGEVGVGGG